MNKNYKTTQKGEEAETFSTFCGKIHFSFSIRLFRHLCRHSAEWMKQLFSGFRLKVDLRNDDKRHVHLSKQSRLSVTKQSFICCCFHTFIRVGALLNKNYFQPSKDHHYSSLRNRCTKKKTFASDDETKTKCQSH